MAFGSDFTNEVLAEAQRSISRYISSEPARELLYRLSLIPWDFGVPEVKAISEVVEIVNHPNEHLITLNNIWIQQINSKLFQVSPVIKNIGENNLPDSVIKNVYAAYAASLAKSSPINQRTGMRAIFSFVKGELYNDAGLLLFHYYRSVRTVAEAELLEQWGYLNFWNEAPPPEQMRFIIQVHIKTEQLRLTKMLNRDTVPIFAKIHGYLTKPDAPEMEVVMFKIYILSQYPE